MGWAVMMQEDGWSAVQLHGLGCDGAGGKGDDCKVDGKLELAEEVMGGIWQWYRGMALRREEQVLAEVTQTSSLGL